MLVIIDNYDSFTFNLVQCLGELGADIKVYRNDKTTPSEIEKINNLKAILISPGPCTPNKTGISNEVIKKFAGQVPILGVCLGHQCIAESFGAKIIRAPRLMHGKVSSIHYKNSSLYDGLPSPFIATRYHSLIVEPKSLPKELYVTSWTDEGEIMGLRHRYLEVEGVQFHPESILTTWGPIMLANFMKRTNMNINVAAVKPRLVYGGAN